MKFQTRPKIVEAIQVKPSNLDEVRAFWGEHEVSSAFFDGDWINRGYWIVYENGRHRFIEDTEFRKLYTCVTCDGTQKVLVRRCAFTQCGSDIEWDERAHNCGNLYLSCPACGIGE